MVIRVLPDINRQGWPGPGPGAELRLAGARLGRNAMCEGCNFAPAGDEGETRPRRFSVQ